MITYMDRVVISAAVPSIQKELGLSIVAMGWILSSFRWGYALFQIPGGWLGDRFGARRALTGIVIWWSGFTALTAASFSAASMAIVRFLFGMGEAGAFPIATRSLSRWMLPTERGYAQGITHAGSRLGAAFTPPIVVWLIASYGWRTPFLVFGALGLVWAAVWFWYYRDTPEEHGSLNDAERALIREQLGGGAKRASKEAPWKAIFAARQVWVLSAMYFCYGYSLAVYLDWFPKYLNAHRGFDLKQMGIYASLPLLAGVVGDFLGGWLSDRWAHSSGNLRLARRGVGAFGFALASLCILPATLTADAQWSVVFTCLAYFGLELTVGVSWAIPLDIGGDFAGSVAAVMNTMGNVGGAISAAVVGYLVQGYGWNVPFLVSAALCVTGSLLFARIDASRKLFT